MALRKNLEYEAELQARERLSARYIRLTLKCPEIAAKAEPGQFVNLSCGEYLRRPLAVAACEGECFTLGIEIKGKGTKKLAELPVGSRLSVLGPLGRGFKLEGASQLVLAGGGTGIFPLQLVLQKASEAGIETLSCFGFRSLEESFLLDELEAMSGGILFTSDAGDFGLRGHVGNGLEKLWEEGRIKEGARVLTCGPDVMMKAVAAFAKEKGLACQVSREQHMACGVGLCLVCVCKTKAEDSPEGFTYKRSCLEGPVFDADEMIWD